MLSWLWRLALAAAVCGAWNCGDPEDPGVALWTRVGKAFDAGKYELAVNRLEELESVSPDWRIRAVGWRVVLLGGLTRAYLELNEACERGLKENEQGMNRSMRVALEQYRKDARLYSLELAEAVRRFDRITGRVENVSLDFQLPDGEARASPVLTRIAGGMMPTGNSLHGSERHTILRGVLLQASEVAGAGRQTDIAQRMFEYAPVSIPKDVFLLGVGRTLRQAAELYEVERLRDHTKQEMFLDLAEECARPSLSSPNLTLKQDAEAEMELIRLARSQLEKRPQ